MTVYHMGQCRPCKRRFRWVGRELQVADARCLGCDGPLIRAAGGSRRGSGVEDVEAAWLAAPAPPEAAQVAPQALNLQDPATWPSPMAMRRGQRRKARRGGRRATDRQDPLDRLLADVAQVPGPAADE